jgi:thiol-disulfide isomerase/thioredoxin
MIDFAAKLAAGLPYREFLSAYGNQEQLRRWQAIHDAVQLSQAQQTLLGRFTRRMHVICLAGTWCGDCVNQCPIFDHFATASPQIDLRFFDRDANPELSAALQTCGGARVPTLVFLSEDGFECGRYGDRTLSKYRQVVADMSGAACPTGLVIPERPMLDAVVQDWLNEFERVQWMLRTSARLRKLHAD